MTREEILSTAKPILFNTDMVRAVMDGRKTVTRRLVKPKSPKACGFYVTFDSNDNFLNVYDYDEEEEMFETPQTRLHIGDILYVRETWGEDNHNFLYRADFSDTDLKKLKNIMKWRPSIHMPKEVARIFLRVTDVRVERLQDITEEQAINEGCNGEFVGTGEMLGSGWKVFPQDEFSEIWDSTIKKSDLDKYGWDANPWVLVIEFERVNIENG